MSALAQTPDSVETMSFAVQDPTALVMNLTISPTGVIGGSSELPMWLTGCFLVTFFGRWRGAVRIHVSHVWLTCTVMPSCVAFPQWWRGAPHVQLMCGSHAR